MIQGIKHIIFDLGGVILNIDYQLTQKAFADLGIHPREGLYSQQAQSEIFDSLEIGKLSGDKFIQHIQSLSDQVITEKQVREAWNAMLLDFPLRRLQILQQLQLHYNIFLLSNTNEIHELEFNKQLQRVCGYPSLAVFFDKVYLSHRVGMRKPDAAIFEHVLNDNQLQAHETLFIDDSLQHIQTAQRLGIQVIHMTNGITMEETVFKPKS